MASCRAVVRLSPSDQCSLYGSRVISFWIEVNNWKNAQSKKVNYLSKRFTQYQWHNDTNFKLDGGTPDKKEHSIGDAFVEIFRHLFVVYFFSYKFSIYVDTYFVYGFYFLHIFFSLLCDEVELLSSAINSFKHVASRFHNFGFYVNFSSWAKKKRGIKKRLTKENTSWIYGLNFKPFVFSRLLFI